MSSVLRGRMRSSWEEEVVLESKSKRTEAEAPLPATVAYTGRKKCMRAEPRGWTSWQSCPTTVDQWPNFRGWSKKMACLLLKSIQHTPNPTRSSQHHSVAAQESSWIVFNEWIILLTYCDTMWYHLFRWVLRPGPHCYDVMSYSIKTNNYSRVETASSLFVSSLGGPARDSMAIC